MRDYPRTLSRIEPTLLFFHSRFSDFNFTFESHTSRSPFLFPVYFPLSVIKVLLAFLKFNLILTNLKTSPDWGDEPWPPTPLATPLAGPSGRIKYTRDGRGRNHPFVHLRLIRWQMYGKSTLSLMFKFKG